MTVMALKDLQAQIAGLDWPRRIMAVFILLLPVLILTGRAPADIAASVTALLFLLVSLRERDFAWARQPWVIVGLAVWLYLSTINAFFSIDAERTFPTAIVWARFLVFVAATQAVLSLRPRLLDFLLWVFLAATLFTAVDGLFQFVHGNDLFGYPMTASHRVTAFTGRPAVGFLLSFLGMPVMVAGIQYGLSPERSATARLLWVIAAILVFLAILVSGERMVLGLTVLGLAVAALLFVRPFKLVVWLLAGLVAAVAALILAVPALYQREVEQTLRELSQFATTDYGVIWSHAWNMVHTYPIFGSGLRTYRLTCALHGVAQSACEDLHPHQLYLEWLSETGLIGTLGFLAMMGFALRSMRGTWSAWRVQPLIAGAVIATLIRLWPLATSGSFFTNRNETVFWFLLGLALVLPLARKDSR